jgi:hypothetical protein
VIVRTLDEETGIILVTGTGAWTPEDVDSHYADLRRMIEKLRDEGRPVRVLSDVAGAPRQTPAIEARILGRIRQTFRAGDRFAIVTANADDKAHVRMLIGEARCGVFASRLPAEMWLLLDEPA